MKFLCPPSWSIEKNTTFRFTLNFDQSTFIIKQLKKDPNTGKEIEKEIAKAELPNNIKVRPSLALYYPNTQLSLFFEDEWSFDTVKRDEKTNKPIQCDQI